MAVVAVVAVVIFFTLCKDGRVQRACVHACTTGYTPLVHTTV